MISSAISVLAHLCQPDRPIMVTYQNCLQFNNLSVSWCALCWSFVSVPLLSTSVDSLRSQIKSENCLLCNNSIMIYSVVCHLALKLCAIQCGIDLIITWITLLTSIGFQIIEKWYLVFNTHWLYNCYKCFWKNAPLSEWMPLYINIWDVMTH